MTTPFRNGHKSAGLKVDMVLNLFTVLDTAIVDSLDTELMDSMIVAAELVIDVLNGKQLAENGGVHA